MLLFRSLGVLLCLSGAALAVDSSFKFDQFSADVALYRGELSKAFGSIGIMCDSLVPTASKFDSRLEDEVALRKCLEDKSDLLANLVANVTQAYSISRIPQVTASDCSSRLPVVLSVLERGVPMYGSVYPRHPSRPALSRMRHASELPPNRLKRALDRFLNQFAWYTNPFTCADQLDLLALAETLDRIHIKYYDPTSKEAEKLYGHTFAAGVDEFRHAFADLRETVLAKLGERADRIYEQKISSPISEKEREEAEMERARSSFDRKTGTLNSQERVVQSQWLDLRPKMMNREMLESALYHPENAEAEHEESSGFASDEHVPQRSTERAPPAALPKDQFDHVFRVEVDSDPTPASKEDL